MRIPGAVRACAKHADFVRRIIPHPNQAMAALRSAGQALRLSVSVPGKDEEFIL